MLVARIVGTDAGMDRTYAARSPSGRPGRGRWTDAGPAECGESVASASAVASANRPVPSARPAVPVVQVFVGFLHDLDEFGQAVMPIPLPTPSATRDVVPVP